MHLLLPTLPNLGSIFPLARRQEGMLAHNVIAALADGDRPVVLKRYDLTDGARRRLLRNELGIALGVRHPCVMPVTAAFAAREEAGLMGYIEMPRYPYTLESWLLQQRPSQHAALAILRQVGMF